MNIEEIEKHLPDRILELICSFHHRKCKDCKKLLQNEDFNKHYSRKIAIELKKIYSDQTHEFKVKHSFQCYDCFNKPKCINKVEEKGYFCYTYDMNFLSEPELQSEYFLNNWEPLHATENS